MADEGTEGAQTFTQEEVEAKVAEANKAIERSRNEALADKRKAREEADELRKQLGELQSKMHELEQSVQAKDSGVSDDKLAEIRDKVRKDLERTYAPLKDQLAERDELIAARDGRIRELTLDNRVKEFMGKAGARANRINDLFKLTGERFELSEDGDVIVKANRELPVDKYLTDTLANEYPEFWNGSGSSGGGASKSSGGAAGAVKTIAAGDNDAFISNLAGVASGEVEVR